jgi:hypothetical protein
MKPVNPRTSLQLMQFTKFDTLGEQQSHDLRKVNCQLSEIQNQLQELFASGVREGMIHHLQSEVQALYNSLLENLSKKTSIDKERAELRQFQQRLTVLHLECEIEQLNETIGHRATKGKDIAGDRAQLDDLQSQLREIEGDL